MFVAILSGLGLAWLAAPSLAVPSYEQYETNCKSHLEANAQAGVVCACLVRNLKIKGVSEEEMAAFVLAQDEDTPEEIKALVDFEAQLAEICLANPDHTLEAD